MIPSSENELSEYVRSARAPIAIRGGDTRGFADRAEGQTLVTSGLSAIKLYEPDSLTLIAEAGTPVKTVEKVLDGQGQCLPFEPMNHRSLLKRSGTPTIGGVVAANISGPRRVQVGACRDYLIGVRFVDGRGRVIRSGGRVMKNVTGYDLVKLLAGSYGTLGILTEVAFKVLPKARAQATLVLFGLNYATANEAMADALSSPFEVTGAAHEGQGESSRTLFRLEGHEQSVLYRRRRLASLLRKFGDFELIADPAESQRIWDRIRDVRLFARDSGDVWKISVKPTCSPQLVERIKDNMDCQAIFDWGGGLVWMLVPEGTEIRPLLGAFKGHATLVRATRDNHSRLGTFERDPLPIRKVGRMLKQQFDPNSLLNPGLLGL